MDGAFIQTGTDTWVNAARITAVTPREGGPTYDGHHEALILMDNGIKVYAGRGVTVPDVIDKLARVAVDDAELPGHDDWKKD